MIRPESIGTAAVAGASGWIGTHLRAALEAGGTEVRTVGRGPSCDATWTGGFVDVLDGADLVVNLAGRSVSCRYPNRTADEIFSSRIATIAALGRALAATARPPSLWINASTGTIYRDARDDEATGELGSGFSVEVARAWEHELFAAPTPSGRSPCAWPSCSAPAAARSIRSSTWPGSPGRPDGRRRAGVQLGARRRRGARRRAPV